MASDGSLAALTAEVRQLRVAVEALARSQTEAQALSAYISAQQSRLAQAGQQLDAARMAVAAVTTRIQEIEANLLHLSDQLSRTTERQERAELEDRIRQFREEQSRMQSELQLARNRESELSRALQMEQAQWDDIVSDISMSRRPE